MYMKRLSVLLCASLAWLMAAAQTGRDTTIIVNQQRIVITTHKGETHVAVYDSTDNQLLKTRETVFANQQEVERVYVTSPFLPSTYTRAAALAPILPTVRIFSRK